MKTECCRKYGSREMIHKKVVVERERGEGNHKTDANALSECFSTRSKGAPLMLQGR